MSPDPLQGANGLTPTPGSAPRVLAGLALVTQPQAHGGGLRQRNLGLWELAQGGGCPGTGVGLLSWQLGHPGYRYSFCPR